MRNRRAELCAPSGDVIGLNGENHGGYGLGLKGEFFTFSIEKIKYKKNCKKSEIFQSYKGDDYLHIHTKFDSINNQ